MILICVTIRRFLYLETTSRFHSNNPEDARAILESDT